ncbi:MAG: D-aminoacyl-tRNA deacylase [Phycisphaerae bacterium]|nr:D-aminoacyl-tRNA deacylase [Phycisphaerae bacterium]
MRAVIERVASAAVDVDGEVVGSIDHGLLVYLGVAVDDGNDDVAYLVNKVHKLRVFEDDQGKMNLDVMQVRGSCLVVSAFTTQGDGRGGHRPSFTQAAPPDYAQQLYEIFCHLLRTTGVPVATGRFRAAMQVRAVNAGPICLLLDSRKLF